MQHSAAVVIISLTIAGACHGRAITVAKSNGDYPTITAGLNAAGPGDTVYVKAGTYAEFVTWPRSGSAGASIVLKAFGDGPAILSGAGLTITQANAQLLLINGRSYLAVIGLEIRDNVTASGSIFNKGIQIEGASQHIIIRGCNIHAIENNNTTTSAGANAIGVFGTTAATPISDLLIDSCEVHDNKTGYSEAISIDGNVDGFRVTRCYVHDNNNIGILIAGFYGECANCGAADQARHGVVSDNRVERCSSCSNPSYAGDCSADGIYSDGGGKSVFERNIVAECDIGIEAGAELASAVDDSMVVRDNLIRNCTTGGMFIGGYATARGWTVNCVVENNTFYMNDASSSGSGEFLIQKSHDNVIRNNIFYTTTQKLALSNAFNSTSSYNNAVDNNLFCSASGSAGVQGASLDGHAKSGSPVFVNPGTDFHLGSGSAAIDACSPSYQPAPGELDLDGNPRKIGGAVDIGAYEAGSAAVPGRLLIRRQRPHLALPRLVISPASARLPRVCVTSSSATRLLPDGKTVRSIARGF